MTFWSPNKRVPSTVLQVCTILQRVILLYVNYLSFASVFFYGRGFCSSRETTFLYSSAFPKVCLSIFSSPRQDEAFSAGILTVGGVLAGPGGYVTIINATPYNFQLTYSHEYEMDCKPVSTISSGTSHEQYHEFWRRSHVGSAAEATYSLSWYPNPASFTVQAREDKDNESKSNTTTPLPPSTTPKTLSSTLAMSATAPYYSCSPATVSPNRLPQPTNLSCGCKPLSRPLAVKL